MTKKLKISWDEITALLCITYNIKNVKLMRRVAHEGYCEIYEIPEYIEGEKK